MSKETQKKYKTVTYSSLPIHNTPGFATHTIAGSINDTSFKEFRDFIKKTLDDNKKIDDELREHNEKQAFNKIHDPDAKPVFFSTKPKVERINLVVDSLGGSCSSMTNIIALMKSCPIPIDTYCFGVAMSAGFMIFIHGNRRYIDKTVDFMFHSLSTMVWDNAPNIQRNANHITKINQMYQQIVVDKTGLTMEWVKQNEERDIHFLHEELLDNKIADVLVIE